MAAIRTQWIMRLPKLEMSLESRLLEDIGMQSRIIAHAIIQGISNDTSASGKGSTTDEIGVYEELFF
jgi:hypothetical protein